MVAVCLFRKFETAKKKQKKSLTTEFQITKLVVLLLVAIQPLINECLMSMAYIFLIPVVFLLYFIKPPVALLRMINYINCLFLLVQNLY